VNWTLAAKPAEQLVRGTVLPQLARADEHVLKIGADRRHLDLLVVVAERADVTG
jgi:hypothetical protein